jgi:hypothetical protein
VYAVRRFKLFLFIIIFISKARAEEVPPLATEHEARSVQGWTVRVDRRLMQGEGAQLGVRGIELLNARLLEITYVVSGEPLARLREVPVQVDLSYGALKPMQYHPNPGWLREHGYEEALAKCVHIPDVRRLLSPYEVHRMPCSLLHELAHSYHDRVLGFNEPRIAAAWAKFRDSGKYGSVLTINGGHRQHYALTNPQEFFAEMTESYLGTNDFYPFVAGELKEAAPEVFKLMEDIWGPLPAMEEALR